MPSIENASFCSTKNYILVENKCNTQLIPKPPRCLCLHKTNINTQLSHLKKYLALPVRIQVFALHNSFQCFLRCFHCCFICFCYFQCKTPKSASAAFSSIEITSFVTSVETILHLGFNEMSIARTACVVYNVV